MQKTDFGAGLAALPDGLLRFPARIRIVIHVDDGRVNHHHSPAGPVLCFVNRIHKYIGRAERRHDRVHSMLHESLQHRADALHGCVVCPDHCVGGRTGMTPSQNPVRPNHHARQRNSLYRSSRKLFHKNPSLISFCCDRRLRPASADQVPPAFCLQNAVLFTERGSACRTRFFVQNAVMPSARAPHTAPSAHHRQIFRR